MRITEIAGIPAGIRNATNLPAPTELEIKRGGRTPTYTQRAVVNNVVRFMLDNGYNRVGDGTNAEVMEFTGKGKVVKVFFHDEGYLQWVGFCKDNKDNPYLPKFRSNVITLKRDEPKVYAVAIEKLTPNTDYMFRLAFQHLVMYWDHLVGATADYEKYVEELRASGDEIDPVSKEHFHEILSNKHLAYVADFLSGFGNRVDLHSENIMMRGNHPVIIDPILN